MSWSNLWWSVILADSHFIFHHWQIWWSVSLYYLGNYCVLGLMLSFFVYNLRVHPTLNIKSNGWNMRCKSHFHMRRCLIHNLLFHFFLYLIHLSPHVLCQILGYWNVQIFPCCGHQGQWHRSWALWSGLMKGRWMGKVSQPYKGTCMTWKMGWVWQPTDFDFCFQLYI